MPVPDVQLAPVETGAAHPPGRARRVLHGAVGVLSWVALALLLFWRLPAAPSWRLPLPLEVLVPLVALALVLLALVWARTADRRR